MYRSDAVRDHTSFVTLRVTKTTTLPNTRYKNIFPLPLESFIQKTQHRPLNARE